jgi:hypothetical protein
MLTAGTKDCIWANSQPFQTLCPEYLIHNCQYKCCQELTYLCPHNGQTASPKIPRHWQMGTPLPHPTARANLDDLLLAGLFVMCAPSNFVTFGPAVTLVGLDCTHPHLHPHLLPNSALYVPTTYKQWKKNNPCFAHIYKYTLYNVTYVGTKTSWQITCITAELETNVRTITLSQEADVSLW